MKYIKSLAAAALAAVMAAGMAACSLTDNGDTAASSKAESTTAAEAVTTDEEEAAETETAAPEETKAPETTTTEKPEEPKEEFKYIGEEDGEDSTYSFPLTNGTEQEIISFALRYGDGDFTENLIPDGEDFAADETRLLNWTHTVTGDVMTLGEFNAEITLDNEKTYLLHVFPMSDIINAEIRVMDEYAFIVYENKIGDTKSTMEQEEKAAEEDRKAEEAKTSTTTTVSETETETKTETETEAETVTEAPAETQPPVVVETEAPYYDNTWDTGYDDGAQYW